jgi:hypothetical protein
MRVFHNRLLVTLVLTAIVSATVSSGALAALRSFHTTTNTSASGVSGIDRTATPTSGDPDAGGDGRPATTKTLLPHSSGSGFQRPGWDWTSWIWATVMARYAP